MCGISGIVYNGIPKQTEKFKSSAKLQQHRGPDYVGYYGDNSVDLMHHRLSILDLDKRSNQPFSNRAKDKILVYNGEIYNYGELKKLYKFTTTTTSDTEILFQLLNEPDFNPEILNGIYAFAYYDVNKKEIQLFRDKLGVKPLYYYKDNSIFIFASEAKVIYNYLEQLTIDYKVLAEFLTFGHSNGAQTIISGVKKLDPGMSLTLDINEFAIKLNQFWSLKNTVYFQKQPSYNQAKIKTLNLLHKAVKRQCMSDVSVGAYLSGGIDSSAVVAIASKFTTNPLVTYSVNFDNSSKSELKAAKTVAKKFGTEHHEFMVKTKQADDFITELLYQYDEPFADPAMIPLHLIAQKAKNNLKVVLQGDGGDEIFAGYGRYLDLKNYRLRKYSFQALQYVGLTNSLRASSAKRFQRLNNENAELMASLVERDAFVNLMPYFRKPISVNNPLENYFKSREKFKDFPLMQQMLYTDMENILPHKYLEKVDKVNMLHSIEARVPFLDDNLVDYVIRLPQNFKIKKGITKYFLRDILTGILPNEILNAKKQSFGTPFPDWTNNRTYNFAKHHFLEASKTSSFINYNLLLQYLEQLNRNHNPSKRMMVWKFLVFTIWYKFYEHKIVNFN